MTSGGRTLIGVNAPEFPTRLKWFNSEPIKLKKLLADKKVALIDFWTYSCVNCLNTLPFLNSWHERYAAKGLTIIGAHTPEFEFEKDPANVERAIKALDIKYPVVLDSDYQIWRLYANRFWPRKLLIAPNGKVVYDHAGEGAYTETEQKIQELLGVKGAFLLPAENGDNGLCYRATPELYLGYKRGYVSNLEGFFHDLSHRYTDAGEHELDMWYLAGEWLARPEYIEYVGQPGLGRLTLAYAAFSVNLVAGLAPNTPPTEIVIKQKTGSTMNDKRLKISGSTTYPIVNDPEFSESELVITPQGPGVRLYVFTFGGCSKPVVVK